MKMFQAIQTYIQAIRDGDIRVINEPDSIVSRPIVSLLTATPDLVFEITPGALMHSQKQIIEALTYLQLTNPDRFNEFYKGLQKDFDNMHKSTSWRYPGRDFKLLTEYYLRSGKFHPRYMTSEQLIDFVSRKLTLEEVKKFIEQWSKNKSYLNNREGLLKLAISKFGPEESLNKESLERIANGENLMRVDEDALSLEEKKEAKDFEKRIKLLAAIRKGIKLPTLQQFQEAYY